MGKPSRGGRQVFVDLDLRGVSEIVNPKVSNRAFNFVKDIKNMSAVEMGAFETKKMNDSRILFDKEKEGIRQVLDVKVSDSEEKCGILTEKSLYVTDLKSDVKPLLSTPQHIQNIDYDLSLITDFPQGIVACASSPMSTTLTHVLVLTADRKLYHLHIDFESGRFDDFSAPKLKRKTYLMDLASVSPIEHIEDKFYFFSGNTFMSYDADTDVRKQLFTLHQKVKTFFIEDTLEDGSLVLQVKVADDSENKVTFHPTIGNFVVSVESTKKSYPFEKNEGNGYDLFSSIFVENEGYLYSAITFIPGSGYFYFYKRLENIEDPININNCVQAKFLSERALPKAPPVPPYISPGVTGMDSKRNPFTGSGFFQVFPIILPSKLINSDGSIPQPDQLHFIKIYETPNKIRSLRFGNQNIITGSLLRQFHKGKLVEFGFNASPELEDIDRTPIEDEFEDITENTSAIQPIDEESAFQLRRKRTVIKAGTNIDQDFVQLDENLPNIYPLPPLSLISETAIVSRVYKALFSWADENGAVHRSIPSLSKTYQGDEKTERFVYLDQVFKIFFRKNDDGSYSEDTTQSKELISQRWDYHLREPEETVELVSPLNFTKKDNVNVEIYSTNPDAGSSLNFFLVKTISNDDLEPVSFPEVKHSVRCEDVVDSKELGTYNTDKFIPETSIEFGRLLLDIDSSIQPDGCYNVAEHDNKLYLGLPYEVVISEPGTDARDVPSLIFKNLSVPVSERILGIFSQDNNVVLFSRKKLHIFNESFDSPRSLRSPDFDLQEDNRHFIEMTEGIIFKDRFKGLFIFTRGNEFSYIGQDVDKKKEVEILDVLHHPKNKEIIFLAEGIIMVYNWFYQIWTFNEDLDAVSGAAVNNELFFNEKLGHLITEKQDEYKRVAIIESHYFSFAKELRRKRFIGLRIKGDLENITFLKAEFAFNGSNNFQFVTKASPDSESLSPTDLKLGKREKKILDCLCEEQKCESVKFRLTMRSMDFKKIKIDKISIQVNITTNKFNIAEPLVIGSFGTP